MPDDRDILRYSSPRWLKPVLGAAAVLAVIVVAVGLVSRSLQAHEADAWTKAAAIPVVRTVRPTDPRAARILALPGTVDAFNSAPIYARVSGYLKQWYVDIGTPVKAGQLLAVIDVPDQDQQLAQAKAELASAIANQKLSAVTAKRWDALLKLHAVAQQDADAKDSDLAAKNAAVASARADVDRLEDLESFKRLTAPFAGVVTSRAVDIGDLVPVGTPADTPLFTVADENRLRIYINVPQSYSADIRPGMTATFTVPEYPDRRFQARVVSTADAINTQTGTLLVELQADNRNRALHPGDYAQVRLSLPADGRMQLPESALMFRDRGMAVATVDSHGRVSIRAITIARNLGKTVEVSSGITPGDRIIDNPPDSIRAGDVVRVAPGTA